MTKKEDYEGLDEKVQNFNPEQEFKEETELGSVMNNLDSDKLDEATRMSSIDFNSRLSDEEINCCIVADEFVRMGILPPELGLTRQKKRLSVSKNGLGRDEKVRIVAGDREMKSGGTFGERLGNLFKRRE